MTTSTNKSLSTPFFALIFASLLLIAGCTNTITGPDATSQDQEEEVVARPFTGEEAPHEGVQDPPAPPEKTD